jgi:hypothetical protein
MASSSQLHREPEREALTERPIPVNPLAVNGRRIIIIAAERRKEQDGWRKCETGIAMTEQKPA